MSWFKEAFGTEPTIRTDELLILEGGKDYTFEILMDEPIVATVKGKKVPKLVVRHDNKLKTLLLWNKYLATVLYNAQMVYGSLKGCIVSVHVPNRDDENDEMKVTTAFPEKQ